MALYDGLSKKCLIALCVLLALGVVLALPGGAPRAQAQNNNPLTLDIEAGYGGSYRVSQWFPVTVVASNDGPDMSGVLEWSYVQGSEALVFQQALDLPRGARKRVTFNALSNEFSRVAEVRFVVNGRAVYEQQVRIEPIEAERFVVGIFSSDATLLNSLSTMQFDTTSGTTVVRFDSDLLPANALALAGIDAMVFHDTDTASLSDEQIAALKLWARLGGQLVVSGGIHTEQTVPGLQDILPIEAGSLESDVALDSLNELVLRNRITDNMSSTSTQVQLQPGARSLDSAQLLTTWALGQGHVIFSAFDVAALRAWTGEPDLWTEVLSPDQGFAPGVIFRWRNDNLLNTVLQLPELQLPSFWVMLFCIAGYILAIGPLNFFVLRRIKRIDLAWITIPATVLLFVIVTYSTSFVLRGFSPQVLQVAVVQGFEGQSQSQATTFLGIFSPRRNTYTMSFGDTALISSRRFGDMASNHVPLVWTDNETRLPDVLVDVSALRSFIVEQTITSDVEVRSSLERTGRRVQGSIENEGAIALEDALLVYNNRVIQLGTLEPGATRQMSPDEEQDLFPTQAAASTEGLFERQLMLEVLFDPNRTMGGFGRFPGNADFDILNEEGVYLLGWQTKPLLDVQINRATREQEGLILHIIQLQT